MSEANFEQRHPSGFSARPSPTIWKDCRKQLINDLGMGLYWHQEFSAPIDFTDPADAPATPDALREDLVGSTVQSRALRNLANGIEMDVDGDTDTAFSAVTSRFSGVQRVQTGALLNDAYALFHMPFCKITLNSGQKVWFEARWEPGAISVDQGAFFGLAAEAGLDRDIVADGASTLDTVDLLGFTLLDGDQDDIDFVFRQGTDALTTVLADITQNTALPAAERSALVANTPRKYGFKFDGRDVLSVFVDGQLLTRTVLAASTFPDNVNFGLIWSHKTGAAAARSAAMDWIRVAYQESY